MPTDGLDKALAVGSSGGTAADQKLPNKQSMDPTSRARAAAAGQQIVQFIEQVIRSSTYIQNQSNQKFNQSTGKYDIGNQKIADQFAWFQVLCNVAILNYDYIRKDFAYKMTFVVVPFETPMLSAYFSSGKYRGVHKAYNYWFTGENNSILSFEQSFNNQWTQAITGGTAPDIRVQRLQNNANTGFMNAWRSHVFPASGQSNQGGEKNTNEPGANAADFLYSSDLASVKLTIVGDPAWLPSPLSDYVTPELFSSRPFYADGTINSVASGAYFSVAFNTPADYNLQTGLIDPDTALTGSRTRTQETVYVASKCTSTFKGGKFTQELSGQWVTYDANPLVKTAGREPPKQTTNQTTNQARPANQNFGPPSVRIGEQSFPIRVPELNPANRPLTNPTATPLSPNLNNAPAPQRGPIVGLPNTAPPPNSIDPVTLLPRNPPNSNPGQVMNREP